MTIEIHKPEIESILQQRLSSGHYRDIEDVLFQALTSSNEMNSPVSPKKTLSEIFAEVRGLAEDLDLSRDPSTSRTIDLS